MQAAEHNARLELAQAALQQAILLDKNGRLQEAFDAYSTALDAFFEIGRAEQDDGKREEIKVIIAEFLERAEQIKRQLKERETLAPAAPKTSAPAADKESRKRVDHYDYTAGRKPKKAVPIAPTAPARRGSKPEGVPESKPLKTSEPKRGDKAEYEEVIMSEMLDRSPGISWDDIAGLDFAKQTLQEAVILPNLRPDLFTGLREPPKGVLLFGPPGTGKTMLAKAVASESGFSFFSITASSVTSKYLGEGEKLMRGLFAVARKHQPAVIFFDEIDALLSARREGEHEASRRLKTEFMVQLDGVSSDSNDRILVMGATNLPQELDEAVLRRLVKKIYVPLPDAPARRALITHLLKKQANSFDDRGIDRLVQMSEGYSASDLTAVCKEAAMGPIRELAPEQLRTAAPTDVRAINEQDFKTAFMRIRPSVSAASLQAYDAWNAEYGSR